MEDNLNIEVLLRSEEEFLTLCLPSHSHPSQDVIGTYCCEDQCVLHIRRLDILRARYHYVQFVKSLGTNYKRESRYIFLSSLKRTENDKIYILSISDCWPTCSTLFARTFGVSLSVLLNAFSDTSLVRFHKQEWYKKTVSRLGESLKTMSEFIQFNSLNQIMVPPSFAARLPKKGTKTISCNEIGRKMQVNIRERKVDTLVRCSICVSLKDLLSKAITESEKKEAHMKHSSHLEYISQQKVIINALSSQSRDDRFDIATMLVDSMSNRHTKFPRLIDRPKYVTDAVRVTFSFTTVQVAQTHGVNKFSNHEYPSLQTMYSHDTSFIISLILDGLSKLNSIPSMLVLVLDSAANNKSNVMIAGLGVILSKVSNLEQIYLLFPCTGHTHLTVDGHFGTLSQNMKNKDMLDPKEYLSFLDNSPSTKSVNPYATIYDFASISSKMVKIQNICSNSQLCMTKNSSGVIHWSSAPTLHSDVVFSKDGNEKAFPLFKDSFDPKSFIPSIRKPEIDSIKTKIEDLIKVCGSLFTDENRDNYRNFINHYGKKSFGEIIMEINQKEKKIAIPVAPSAPSQDPHVTILQYLRDHGYPTGRMPRDPVV